MPYIRSGNPAKVDDLHILKVHLLNADPAYYECEHKDDQWPCINCPPRGRVTCKFYRQSITPIVTVYNLEFLHLHPHLKRRLYIQTGNPLLAVK